MDLKTYGLKSTKTRENILKILKNSKEPLTVDEIYLLNKDDDANLSTIYRTLYAFLEKKLITKEIRNDGTQTFLLKREHHEHILICSRCNKKIYLNKCPFLSIKNEVLNETGFIIDTHNIELYGICKECKEVLD